VCVSIPVTALGSLLLKVIDSNTATGQFIVERDRYVDG
jgi:hypothetical protein